MSLSTFSRPFIFLGKILWLLNTVTINSFFFFFSHPTPYKFLLNAHMPWKLTFLFPVLDGGLDIHCFQPVIADI